MTTISKCDACMNEAQWLVYAAYDQENLLAVHPILARYVLPMNKACSAHLGALLTADRYAKLSTHQWVVTPIN